MDLFPCIYPIGIQSILSPMNEHFSMGMADDMYIDSDTQIYTLLYWPTIHIYIYKHIKKKKNTSIWRWRRCCLVHSTCVHRNFSTRGSKVPPLFVYRYNAYARFHLIKSSAFLPRFYIRRRWNKKKNKKIHIREYKCTRWNKKNAWALEGVRICIHNT